MKNLFCVLSKCPGCDDCVVETLYQRKERALAAIELAESKRPLKVKFPEVGAMIMRSAAEAQQLRDYNRQRIAKKRKAI